MPIDVRQMTQRADKQFCICKSCPSLIDAGEDSMPGYGYRCILLDGSAFDMIPNETIELNAVFPDCPKLVGTENEGTRYKVFKTTR